MIKLEIVRRNYNEFIIYGLAILILVVSILLSFSESISGSVKPFFFIIAVLDGFAIFKIIPNIQIRKHNKIGDLVLNNESIEVNDTFGQSRYDIRELDNIVIKIYGYDGQNRFGTDYMIIPGTRPVNGLGNKLSFMRHNCKYDYEFYIETIPQLDELKNIVNKWSAINNQLNKVITR